MKTIIILSCLCGGGYYYAAPVGYSPVPTLSQEIMQMQQHDHCHSYSPQYVPYNPYYGMYRPYQPTQYQYEYNYRYQYR